MCFSRTFRMILFASVLAGLACSLVPRSRHGNPSLSFSEYSQNQAGHWVAVFLLTNHSREFFMYEPIENLTDPLGSGPAFLFPHGGHTLERRVRDTNSLPLVGLWCVPNKKDPVTLAKVGWAWAMARRWDPWMWVPHLQAREEGFAVWSDGSGKRDSADHR